MINKQFKKNFKINVISFLINLILAVLYIPYLIQNLGISAYGIVPLALIINQYIKVLTTSLTSSLSRFYSIAIESNDTVKASSYLSTTFFSFIIFSLIFVPISFLFSLNIDMFFNISNEFIDDAIKLFIFSLLALSVSLFSNLFGIVFYVKNRLDYIKYLSIGRVLLKFLIIILLFNLLSIRVYYVGLASLISEFLLLVFSLFLYNKISDKDVVIKFRFFDKLVFMPVLIMSIWVIIQQVGDIFLYRIDTILINLFFGVYKTGVIGAISELGLYFTISIGVFSSLFGPIILNEYSNSNHSAVKELTVFSSFLTGFIAAVIAGISVSLSDQILKFWIGDEFSGFYLWLSMKLFLVPFFVSGGVFAFTYRAWNKVKIPAVITLVLGFINLILSYSILSFYSKTTYSIEIILLLSLIISIIQCYLLNALIFTGIYKDKLNDVINNFFRIALVFILSFCCAFVLRQFVFEFTIPILLLFFLITFFFSGYLSFQIIFIQKEKNKTIDLIKNFLSLR
tara:strand:- start:2503 stop:4035 length:1533 start_codon:yes stop_codon:yes gene_type:complete